ncbi:hypothetical protein ACSQ67_021086 [Phaseolus vulgaris]
MRLRKLLYMLEGRKERRTCDTWNLSFGYGFALSISIHVKLKVRLSPESKRMEKVSPKEKIGRFEGLGVHEAPKQVPKRVVVLHAKKSVKEHDKNVRVFDKSLVKLSPVNLVSHGVGSSEPPKPLASMW